MQPPKHLPRWRCGEHTCTCRSWQRTPLARGPGDLDATQRAYTRHYLNAHPELVDDDEEVVWDGHALAA